LVDDPAPIGDGFRNAVLAIGSFDGVHLGHQALIAKATTIADELGTSAIALTFEPHPRTVLQQDAPFFRLTPPPAKRQLLGLAGAAGVAEVVFDQSLAKLSAADFVASVLAGRLRARAVVVGEGFRFGNRRSGDTDLLAQLGRGHGYRTEILPTVVDAQGKSVSSGRVRAALGDGDLADANATLGYRWFVTGTVVDGDRRGRELGYPTANLGLIAPIGLKHGIYAVSARWPGGGMRQGVASFGVRPMFGSNTPLLEVHIFDFNGDLYGTDLTVSFHAYLRPEERFPSAAALIRQMDVDSAESRVILEAADTGTAFDRALTDGD
jgi:riboflavin kinase/FMN adenylyltransferase